MVNKFILILWQIQFIITQALMKKRKTKQKANIQKGNVCSGKNKFYLIDKSFIAQNIRKNIFSMLKLFILLFSIC